jgi:hypothetical protein
MTATCPKQQWPKFGLCRALGVKKMDVKHSYYSMGLILDVLKNICSWMYLAEKAFPLHHGGLSRSVQRSASRF